MDPQQELFAALLLALRKQGYDVYDGALPPEDTPYPFLYLGDSRQTDEPSPSTRRVWIEISNQRLIDLPKSGHPPRGGCGLK